MIDNDAMAIGELYRKAKASLIDSVRYQIECGHRLAEKKASLIHGEWLPWLEANREVLGFESRRTASRLISLASNGTSTSHLSEAEAVEISRETWGNVTPVHDSYERTPGPDGACCGFEQLHQLVADGIRFGNIYADPPWLYDNQGTRAATSNHYQGLTVDQLCDAELMPIAKLAAADAHLHLWTTNGFLFECQRIRYVEARRAHRVRGG